MLAVQVCESLLGQLPQVRTALLSAMGQLHLSMGDLPSAQELFARVVDEEGEGVRSHLNQ